MTGYSVCNDREIDMISIEDVRDVFADDKYLVGTGVVIEEAGFEYCKCSLIASDDHMNAGGAVQGGAIYTLADSAFAVASNFRHLSENDGFITVSQSASISYLTAGKNGEKLLAIADKIGGGKRTPVYCIDVYGEDDRLVATMIGNGYSVVKK
ncbi:MAG: hotdog fold thioesterase [Clostridiales Family XIII bacterium]|nr:hotdog fold thioesterase [Clostridiales Family XIII bacterium]